MGKFRDLTGQKFGHLTVIERSGKTNPSRWKAICDCAEERELTVIGTSLTKGITKSCGHLVFAGGWGKDWTGNVFSRLTVISRAPNTGTRTRWNCLCVCGKATVVATSQLRTGRTKSCGCLALETRGFNRRLRPFEALYNIFQQTAISAYNASGITYEEFLEFTKIIKCHYCSITIPWNPYTGNGKCAYYLDRKDSLLGYSVGNCVVCCTRCNWGKSNTFSYEEWLEIGKAIKAFRERVKRVSNRSNF